MLFGREAIFPREEVYFLPKALWPVCPFFSCPWLERIGYGNLFGKTAKGFLCGGRAPKKKPQLIMWDVVCSAKSEGGLGVRNLTKLNKVFLGKWV